MEEPIPVRYAFVMMLAIADESGVVVGTDVAIARRINMPLPEFQDAIRVLSAPDPESNNMEHEGRRIIQSAGERGYQVVSYVKYRGMRTEEDRRGYMRDYMRKYRGDNVNVNESLQEFTKANPASASASVSASESASEEGCGGKPKSGFTRPSLEEIKLHGQKIGLPDSESEKFFDHYESNGWKVGRNPMRSWRSAMSNWKRNWDEQTYANNHQTHGRAIQNSPRKSQPDYSKGF